MSFFLTEEPEVTGFTSLLKVFLSIPEFCQVLQSNRFPSTSLCAILKVLFTQNSALQHPAPDFTYQLSCLTRDQMSSPNSLFRCIVNELEAFKSYNPSLDFLFSEQGVLTIQSEKLLGATLDCRTLEKVLQHERECRVLAVNIEWRTVALEDSAKVLFALSNNENLSVCSIVFSNSAVYSTLVQDKGEWKVCEHFTTTQALDYSSAVKTLLMRNMYPVLAVYKTNTLNSHRLDRTATENLLRIGKTLDKTLKVNLTAERLYRSTSSRQLYEFTAINRSSDPPFVPKPPPQHTKPVPAPHIFDTKPIPVPHTFDTKPAPVSHPFDTKPFNSKSSYERTVKPNYTTPTENSWSCSKCSNSVSGSLYECVQCRLINWDKFYEIKAKQRAPPKRPASSMGVKSPVPKDPPSSEPFTYERNTEFRRPQTSECRNFEKAEDVLDLSKPIMNPRIMNRLRVPSTDPEVLPQREEGGGHRQDWVCPQCASPNTISAKYCWKCRSVLSLYREDGFGSRFN